MTERNNVHECSLCCCDFDPLVEGGILGCIGILPIALCPTCRCGVFDMVEAESLYVADLEFRLAEAENRVQ